MRHAARLGLASVGFIGVVFTNSTIFSTVLYAVGYLKPQSQRVTFSPPLSIKDSPAKSAAEKEDAKTNAKLNFFIFLFFF
jgi:hypothetical protein